MLETSLWIDITKEFQSKFAVLVNRPSMVSMLHTGPQAWNAPPLVLLSLLFPLYKNHCFLGFCQFLTYSRLVRYPFSVFRKPCTQLFHLPHFSHLFLSLHSLIRFELFDTRHLTVFIFVTLYSSMQSGI